MSQFTIIVDDGRMAVNGEGYTIDLAELAAQGIHAVQFYGEYGEIEFKPVFDAETRTVKKPMNEVFTEALQFHREIARWELAKEQAEEAAAAAKAEADRIAAEAAAAAKAEADRIAAEAAAAQAVAV